MGIEEQISKPSRGGDVTKHVTVAGWFCLAFVVFCEVGLLYISGRAFYVIPPGTHIRPMGLVAVIGLFTLSLAGFGCIAGVLVAAIGWKSRLNWILGGVIFTLGISFPWLIINVIRIICDMHN